MNSKNSFFMNFYKFACTVDEEDFCQKVAAFRHANMAYPAFRYQPFCCV